MKITYVKHSGFVVEYKDTVLIFDYYKGELPKIAPDKKVYVFASHQHYDHFQKSIFDWQKHFLTICYILSDDIKDGMDKCEVLPVKARQKLTVDELTIQTLRSTDEGVAFLVTVDGVVIYHAGDLNWWHWEEEGAVYNEWMKRNYQHEIDQIQDMKIDVAFVPVDGRLGIQYYWGLDYLMKHTDTRYVFPMHMWRDYSVYEKLMQEADAAAYKDKVFDIKEEGEVFELCM